MAGERVGAEQRALGDGAHGLGRRAGQGEGDLGRPVSARTAAPAARRSVSGSYGASPSGDRAQADEHDQRRGDPGDGGHAVRPPRRRPSRRGWPARSRAASAALRSRPCPGASAAPLVGPDGGEHQGVGLDVARRNGRTRSGSSQGLSFGRCGTPASSRSQVRITTRRCRYGEPHDCPGPADLTPARPPRRARRQAGRLRRLGDADRVPRRRRRRASTPRCASAVGVFDVSHLGKASVTRPGRGGLRQRLPDQRPRPDRARPGAVHAVLRRRPAAWSTTSSPTSKSDDDVFLVPNAANTAEVVRRLRAAAPDGVEVTDLHQRLRRARRAGPAQRRGARGARAADRARLHVVRRGRLAGAPGHRVPHRLHRRARLRAGARAGTTRRPCGTR